MAVAIRFSRHGAKGAPFYRIVAADKSFPRDGRFLDIVGTYNPKTKEAHLKNEKISSWLAKGARPSETVGQLLKKNGIRR